MGPNELVNIALDEIVEVEGLTKINSFNSNIQNCIFKFPGISPLRISRIPLYMALHLESTNSVRIIIPSFFSRIEEYIEAEIREEGQFIELPEYLFEMAEILNKHIGNNMSKIKQLEQIRKNKIWKGMENFDGKALCINNLTRWEFNEMKGLICETMKEGRNIQG